MQKKLKAPHVPQLDDDMLDTSNFDKGVTEETPQDEPLTASGLSKVKKYSSAFNDFWDPTSI